MMDTIEEFKRLNRKLDILLTNRQGIEKKLSRNGVDAFKRKGWQYQLERLEGSISRITNQLMEIT